MPYSDAEQVAALFILPVCPDHVNKAQCMQLENLREMGFALQLLANTN